MSDIRIINVTSLDGIWADWLFANGVLDESQQLANIVKMALLTDARADVDEELPDPDATDRRGWWGDYQAETIWNGWPVGCKNWLLTRAKITDAGAREGATVMRAETYTRTALQPMIDQKMCSAIDVFAERVGRERIDVTVIIYRGPKEEITLQFQDLWTEIDRAVS